jgi:hypothetical protein
MKPAFRIGLTEDTLLVFLCRYVRATAEQCTRYRFAPSSLGFVRGRLNDLVDHGYVDVHKGFSQDGKPPFVYCPTLKAWDWAKTTHGLPMPQRWRPSEAEITDFNRYRHALAITDFGLALEQFCRQAGHYVTLVRFIHDRLLPQTKVKLPDGSNEARRLDGYFELRVLKPDSPTPKQRHYLLELDRSSHYHNETKQKFINQVVYLKSGSYQADFARSAFTAYLWVCPGDPERVASLKTLFEKTLSELDATEYATYFLLTAENPAEADPVSLFVKPYWITLDEDEPVRMVTHPLDSSAIPLERSYFMPQEEFERVLSAIGQPVSYLTSEQDAE